MSPAATRMFGSVEFKLFSKGQDRALLWLKLACATDIPKMIHNVF